MHREFHDSGFRVFGIHAIRPDGLCACDNPTCTAPGKHPLASSWQHTPALSDDQLDVMETAGQFDSGYGVLCRGLLVVDIDARNGGLASYERLVAAVPEIAAAGLIVATGSGGGSKHLYFRHDPAVSLCGSLPDYPGIDFKTSGYVVGPGSAHVSGNRYEVLLGEPSDIDEAPTALVDMLRRPDLHRAEVDGVMIDLSSADLAGLIAAIPNESADYEKWIRVGMGLHYATGGGEDGYCLWLSWS